MSVGNFNIGFNRAGRPVADHALCGHRRRLPDPHVRVRTCVRGEEGYPAFRLYQPVYRQHGCSEAVR